MESNNDWSIVEHGISLNDNGDEFHDSEVQKLLDSQISNLLKLKEVSKSNSNKKSAL